MNKIFYNVVKDNLLTFRFDCDKEGTSIFFTLKGKLNTEMKFDDIIKNLKEMRVEAPTNVTIDISLLERIDSSNIYFFDDIFRIILDKICKDSKLTLIHSAFGIIKTLKVILMSLDYELDKITFICKEGTCNGR